MKILHLIPNLGIGGTEKTILELCRGLDKNRFQNFVAAIKSEGETAERLKRIPVPVTALHSAEGFLPGLLDLPRVVFKISQLILKIEPDIVHTWLTRANVVGRLAALLVHHPRTISSLRVMESEKQYHLWAEYLTQMLCNAVTVNCTALEKFAVEKIWIPKNKVVLIFNGIQIPPSPLAGEGRVRDGSDFLIGSIGRLHAQKGMDIFIRAAQIVLKQFPDFKFVVAGDGPEKQSLQKLAHNLGIESQVKFCGWVHPSADFLKTLNIFVLTSRWEGMPNVILEAMALKIPVVATEVGGVPDLIENEKSGLLVESKNTDACAEAMLRLIQQPALRQQFTKNAFQRVSEKFSLKQMIQSYESLYESLVPGKN